MVSTQVAAELGKDALARDAAARAACRGAPHRVDRSGACGRRRWFAVPLGARKDMRFITESLHALGLCHYRHNATPAHGLIDVYFGEQFGSRLGGHAPWMRDFSPAFAPAAAVGSMPGLTELLGSKLAMSRLYRECQQDIADGAPRGALCLDRPGDGLLVSFAVDGEERRHTRSFKYMTVLPKHVPHGDTLRKEIKRLLVDRKGAWTSKWIVKPQAATFLARGIHVAAMDHAKDLRNDAAFFDWLGANFKPPRCKYDKKFVEFCNRRKVTFQHYVEGALVFGRKFDVRVLQGHALRSYQGIVQARVHRDYVGR